VEGQIDFLALARPGRSARGVQSRLTGGHISVANRTAQLDPVIQIGVLSARLDSGYIETRYIANEIISASADQKEGTLTLNILVKQRRSLAQPTKGVRPSDLGEDLLENLSTAIPFLVDLKPLTGKPRYLQGEHVYDPEKLPYQKAVEFGII
jgi:hypothetical protein